MLKILAIDSSSKTATVAVVDENGVIGEFSINHLRHSVILMPMIAQLLNEAEISKNDITHIAVSKGPGSFTGLRIGAATAKGLSQALHIPIAGIFSLDGLAYNVRDFDGLICPVIDALRGYVYAAVYKGGSIFKRVSDIMLIKVEDIKDILNNYDDSTTLFIGDGIDAYKEILKKLNINKLFASQVNNINRASSVGMIAIDKIKSNDLNTYLDFEPYYIRKPATLE